MLKKFGLLISSFIGLLTAFGSGMETRAQSTDLRVRFDMPPNLSAPTAISENSQTSLERQSTNIQELDLLLPMSAEMLPMSAEMLFFPYTLDFRTGDLEDRSLFPRRHSPSPPCPNCGLG